MSSSELNEAQKEALKSLDVPLDSAADVKNIPQTEAFKGILEQWDGEPLLRTTAGFLMGMAAATAEECRALYNIIRRKSAGSKSFIEAFSTDDSDAGRGEKVRALAALAVSIERHEQSADKQRRLYRALWTRFETLSFLGAHVAMSVAREAEKANKEGEKGESVKIGNDFEPFRPSSRLSATEEQADGGDGSSGSSKEGANEVSEEKQCQSEVQNNSREVSPRQPATNDDEAEQPRRESAEPEPTEQCVEEPQQQQPPPPRRSKRVRASANNKKG